MKITKSKNHFEIATKSGFVIIYIYIGPEPFEWISNHMIKPKPGYKLYVFEVCLGRPKHGLFFFRHFQRKIK